MMRSRPSSQLLLLPAGLVVGHAISYSLVQSPSHGGLWLAGSMEGLLCVSVPLAAAALVRAFVAGLRDEPAPVRFALLAGLQVAFFVVVEVAEHAGSPARSSLLLAVAVGVIAQVAAAALACALLRSATALGRRARSRRERSLPVLRVPGLPAGARWGWSTLLLLPMQRRGPPMGLVLT